MDRTRIRRPNWRGSAEEHMGPKTMNPTSERPTQSPRAWLADEENATTTTTMGDVDWVELDLTSGGFYEPSSPVKWSSWPSTLGLVRSISSHLVASGSLVIACQLMSPKFSSGVVQSFMKAIRAVYAIPKDQYGNTFAPLSYWPMLERGSHPEPRSSRVIRLFIGGKEHTDEWPMETQEAIKRRLTFFADCDPAGSVESHVTYSIDPEYPEPEPTTWRGVFAPTHSREVLFSQQIEIRTADLPRWKPHITIDRRTLERDDE
jgi:hypothetical protein